MDDNIVRDRRRRRLPVLVAMAALATVTAACGSSHSTSSTGGSTSYSRALAYSQCMRSHGVPDFPDPNSNGDFNISSGSGGNASPPSGKGGGAVPDINSAQMRSADGACRHLLSHGGHMSPAQSQQVMSQFLRFSQCMRSHGVPNFPDPTPANGGVGLKLNGTGINTQSPQFLAAQRACQSLQPRGKNGAGPSSGGGK